jgi:hypothetical protein
MRQILYSFSKKMRNPNVLAQLFTVLCAEEINRRKLVQKRNKIWTNYCITKGRQATNILRQRQTICQEIFETTEKLVLVSDQISNERQNICSIA